MKYQSKLFDKIEVLVCSSAVELQTKLMELAEQNTLIEIQYCTHRQEQAAHLFTALVVLKSNPKPKTK